MVNYDAPSSVILKLWLPVFFFGHIFAGFWVIRSAVLTKPGFGGPIRRLFSRKARSSKDNLPSKKEGEEWSASRAQSLDTRVLAEATEAVTSLRTGRGEFLLLLCGCC